MNTLFEQPVFLPAAVLIAVAIVVLAIATARRRARRLTRLASPEIIQRLIPSYRAERHRVRAALYGVAAFLLGVALAGPQWGVRDTRIKSEGIDLVIALDASLSMLARDVRPSRLELMKQEVRRLRAASPGDRVGLLAFAGKSYILTPLTVDDGALDLFLDNLDPSYVGQAGSSLARAIRQGTELLVASPAGSDRALVVMSDGEAFEPAADIVEASKRAADAGITLVTVGFGTEGGATIPMDQEGKNAVKHDENGDIVTTRYHPQTLRAAALAAHGTFVDAAATDKASQIRRVLSSLQTQRRTVQAGADRAPRFQYFVLPALLLLLVDTLLAERRRRPMAVVTPASARTAVAAVLLLLVTGTGAQTWPTETKASQDAETEYGAGRFLQAARIYRDAMENGDRTPQTLYNLGTALLAADSLDRAIEIFERLTQDRDEDVRYRAGFNLGLAHLTRGLASDGETRQRALDAALAAYKRVLLLRSADLDAKWNYELALQQRQQGGGGGGGSDQPKPSGESAGNTQPRERPPGSLGQNQAEQILDNAAREERDVQQRKQAQTRPAKPAFGKDW